MEFSVTRQKNDLESDFSGISYVDGSPILSIETDLQAEGSSSVGDLIARTLSLNLYYDFPMASNRFAPYQPVAKVITAFDRPCIPADGVAIRAHTPGMHPNRALSGGRRNGLGARGTFTTDCYVGAGLGASFVEVTDLFYESSYSGPGGPYDPPLEFYSSRTNENLSDTILAKHLYVGVDFGLSERTLLGVKLSHLRMGDFAATGGYDFHPIPGLTSETRFSGMNHWLLGLTVKLLLGR